MLDDAHRARLFSVSGIKGEREAELRATSALLAVLSAVRPLSRAMLAPFGASRADRAEVEAFTEVPFQLPGGEQVRPDGVMQVTSGRSVFRALVEVKVGDSQLDLAQIEKYLRLARAEGYDCLVTISSEIAPFDGAHPTEGAQSLATSKVALHHLSWTRILAEAIKEHAHHGVDDPEQAWLLAELIRYLEHPNSGVRQFSDMGEHWTTVRDRARDRLLPRVTPEVTDVCRRWDQLLHSIALHLGARLGLDVQEVVARSHRANPSLRLKEFGQTLCDQGLLEGNLRVPDAISDLEVAVYIRSSRITIASEFAAPSDKGAKGRVGWLVRQLREAPDELVIGAFSRGARSPELATLAELREDTSRVLRSTKQPPTRFRVTLHSDMGQARRTVRRLGFADSVIEAVERFYSTVLQRLRKATPPAPRPLPAQPETVEPEAAIDGAGAAETPSSGP